MHVHKEVSSVDNKMCFCTDDTRVIRLSHVSMNLPHCVNATGQLEVLPDKQGEAPRA